MIETETYSQFLAHLIGEWGIPYLLPAFQLLLAVFATVAVLMVAMSTLRALADHGPRIIAALLTMAVAVAMGWGIVALIQGS